jgi:hypothetical protein
MIGSALPRVRLARLAIPAGLIFACALFFGWNAGDTAVPRPPASPKIRWSLPHPRKEDAARDFALIMARRPWGRGSLGGAGAQPGKGPKGAAPPSWRLAGIVERSGESMALILTGAGPAAKLEYFRVGDRLPDGTVLTALARDSATVDGTKPPHAGAHVFRLFDAKR